MKWFQTWEGEVRSHDQLSGDLVRFAVVGHLVLALQFHHKDLPANSHRLNSPWNALGSAGVAGTCSVNAWVWCSDTCTNSASYQRSFKDTELLNKPKLAAGSTPYISLWITLQSLWCQHLCLTNTLYYCFQKCTCESVLSCCCSLKVPLFNTSPRLIFSPYNLCSFAL